MPTLFTILLLSVFLIIAKNGNSQEKHVLKMSHELLPKTYIFEDISYYTLIVPQDWSNPDHDIDKIKLPVAILPSIIESNEYVFHIPGGPGGWSIGAINKWINHPIRKNKNIVLMDLRGTGFSIPQLCPDLGENIFEIFSRDLKEVEEQHALIDAANTCYGSFQARKINPQTFNSNNIVLDIKALQSALNIKKWAIYGVSYGTYIARLFAERFPENTINLILDSPIGKTDEYYSNNGQNFSNSLDLLFTNAQPAFPNLQNQYTDLLDRLDAEPITVGINKFGTSTFTFNKSDFQLLIQQSLYNDYLIPIIPYIVQAFYQNDQPVLSRLAAEFSSNLRRDFGTYYCVTCNDIYDDRMISKMDSSAHKFRKVGGTINFYKSDLLICKDWGLATNQENSLNFLFNSRFIPVLITCGLYDPITPISNGLFLNDYYKNVTLINMPSGHGSSFSLTGKKIVTDYLNGENEAFEQVKVAEPLKILDNVKINTGIYNLVKSIEDRNYLSLVLLLSSLIMMMVSFLIFLIKPTKSKIFKYVLITSCGLGLAMISSLLIAVMKTISYNKNILLIGILDRYVIFFYLLYIFIFSLAFTIPLLVMRLTKPNSKTFYSLLLFSQVIFPAYFIYWDII